MHSKERDHPGSPVCGITLGVCLDDLYLFPKLGTGNRDSQALVGSPQASLSFPPVTPTWAAGRMISKQAMMGADLGTLSWPQFSGLQESKTFLLVEINIYLWP